MNRFLQIFSSWNLGRVSMKSIVSWRPKPISERPSLRPRLEALEDRTLLSTYYVTLATDTNPNGGGQKDNNQANSGDLRWCVTQADKNNGNTIILTSDMNNTPINLVAALPQISQNMTITPAIGGVGYG